jgi:hypothetical protein
MYQELLRVGTDDQAAKPINAYLWVSRRAISKRAELNPIQVSGLRLHSTLYLPADRALSEVEMRFTNNYSCLLTIAQTVEKHSFYTRGFRDYLKLAEWLLWIDIAKHPLPSPIEIFIDALSIPMPLEHGSRVSTLRIQQP